MKTPEGYIKDEVCKFLTSIGAWYFRPFMAGYGQSGIPDIICCIGGRFVGIEVKREGKAPTPRQEFRMKKIRNAKGIAIWGDSFEMIKEQLYTALGHE
jgi:hypothetical protein